MSRLVQRVHHFVVVNLLNKDNQDADKGTTNKNKLPTFNTVYDAIKQSRDSLSREKKKNLEEAIEQVLDSLKREVRENEESDEPMEEAGPSTNEDLSILNRKMTRHWDVTPAAMPAAPTTRGSEGRSTKKRRISPERETVNDAVAKKVPKPSKYGPDKIPPGSVMVAGMRATMQELYRDVFARVSMAQDLACFGERPLGILISGPPGTGKQSLVRALSCRTNIPIISLGRYLSETRSPEKVSKIFNDVLDEAKKIAPCVVLIDHLDEYMAKSGSNHSEFDHEVRSQLKLSLRRLREWESEGSHVVIVCTTSKLELIDTTLRRPDYLGQTISVKVPDTQAREQIFGLLTRDLKVPSEVDFKTLALRTHGFVGDDIRAVVLAANRKASDRFVENEEARARSVIGKKDTETPMEIWDRDYEDVGLLDDFTKHPSYTKATGGQVSLKDFIDAIAEHTPYMRREGFSAVPETTWSEVGALEDVRAAFRVSIIRRIKEPNLFRQFGKQKAAGILLFGPPGCGKTLVAKAVANEAQASFILVKGPELLNKYVGESERAVRELFQRAKSCAPSIIFFDEMDSLVPKRENTTTEAGARVVNALLAELDGAGDRGEVYVIGTSNRPDMIDPAILRPGRLEKKLFIDLPTEDERVDILRTIVKNGITGDEVEGDGAVDIEAIARDKRCAGFSGADLYGLFQNAIEACILRYHEGDAALSHEDWEAALRKTKPSVHNAEAYRKIANKMHQQD
ncbi:putative AAA domain-containing protein C16E9.10c [Colletotrichum chlorophyti]|uniref:Putative AAA domain-containing protein C16E9.10c n=1 Tax=Colletotrichum chlorophyti TaxID=708187 RepID=A0A1Q8S1N2_9PEZI|nr:putative AAA domain-containing protein C16E9.10c [Colletotrichum chlorophyti]